MRKAAVLTGAIVAGFLAAAAPAYAQCTPEPRAVKLDHRNPAAPREKADNVVRLRAYNCRIADDLRIRVEFHHLSDTAASLIFAKQTSRNLSLALGSFRLVENEVAQAYRDLLRQFGRTDEVPSDCSEWAARFGVGGSGEEGLDGCDRISGRTMRTLMGTGGAFGSFSYPAAEEIASLRRGTIPPRLNYFYSITCGDPLPDAAASPPASCKNFDETEAEMIFWRGLRADDVTNYSRNVDEYNRLLKQFQQELRKGGSGDRSVAEPFARSPVPSDLQLARFVAGDNWPEDFVLLLGRELAPGACGDDEEDSGEAINGIDGWDFEYYPRTPRVDAIIIENLSKRPIAIGGLLGERRSEPRLRAGELAAPAAADTLAMNEKLAPGQRILMPTKIAFIPNGQVRWLFPYPASAADVHRRLGADGLTGNTGAHGAPTFRDYYFGPEISASGVLVEGQRVEFAGRSANFINLAVSSEAGSCPFLLSWDEAEREWVTHGKVLHEAPNARREYTETRTFPGFRARFRLEEREPEVAYIDQAELTVVLAGGATLSLAPKQAMLAARDRDYATMYWGEAIELEFVLPEGTAADDVVESKLSVTGYYRRYSSLVAEQERETRYGSVEGPGSAARDRTEFCAAPRSAAANMSVRRESSDQLRR